MSTVRKHKRKFVGMNVYFLSEYVSKALASTGVLQHRAAGALKYQQAQLDYDNQCYANNQCPLCDADLSDEESKGDGISG